MDIPENWRVDRSAFEVTKLTDRPNDRAYWLTKTTRERLEALELLRQIAYGYDPDTERLQRVLEITKLQRR